MQSARIIFPLLAALTLAPFVPAGVALAAGMAIALTVGNPYTGYTHQWTPRLLQASVIGLGAAMNLNAVAAAGRDGLIYTIVGISGALLIGWALGRLLGIGRTIGALISVGTAICGGSAIAALAPTIRAKDHEVSVSMATVFFLNAAALFIFPWVGHLAGFTERQFGLWAALAIHDTSSVVGASMQFGPRALELATTVKLARALWIVPLTLVAGMLWKATDGAEVSTKGRPRARAKVKIPWFILGFIGMAALCTWIPAIQPAGHVISEIAKRALVLTLFLIGSGLSRATLKAVGVRPLVHGVVLWAIVGSLTFLALEWHWIV